MVLKGFFKSIKAVLAVIFAIGCTARIVSAGSSEPQFRGFWVDAFHNGFQNPDEVTKLIADVRAAHANAVFVQVRKRGDAYYNSSYEPKAASVAENFDPLADILAKAHDTKAGPRIEVHAWLTTYPVWNGEAGFPSQKDHPYVRHSDWLCRNSSGGNYDGRFYSFDPGHPAVQQYLFDIAMDIVSKYDVDGLQFDYVHYSGRDWGYNPVAVKRFKNRYNRKGDPAPTDPQWTEFRREQVTALLRKIYLSVAADKPRVAISAATITWPPPPANDDEWLKNSHAMNDVFQDWRSWMMEGIIDINVPMIYSPEANLGYHRFYSTWIDFAREHRYGRHVVISPALFMNSSGNSIKQIRQALAAGKNGSQVDGVCLYSYASYATNQITAEGFYDELAQSKNRREQGVFASIVPTPDLPWKSAPKLGHLKGIVSVAGSTNILDGATISIDGSAKRSSLSDGTGFYGSVDLLPGDYSITASMPGFKTETRTCSVTKGTVTTMNLVLTKQ